MRRFLPSRELRGGVIVADHRPFFTSAEVSYSSFSSSVIGLMEQLTREELEEKCQDYFQIEVQDVRRAVPVIEESFPRVQTEVFDDRTLRIYGLEKGAELNQVLIENQISVEASGFHRMDLEEYFLDRMEGGEEHV